MSTPPHRKGSKNPFRPHTAFSDNVAESVDYLLTALSRAWKENKCICQVGKDDMPRTTRQLLNGAQAFQGLRVGAPSNLGLIRKIERFVVQDSEEEVPDGYAYSRTNFQSTHPELGTIPKGSCVCIHKEKLDLTNLGIHFRWWIDWASGTGILKTKIHNATGGTIDLEEGEWYITVITYGD